MKKSLLKKLALVTGCAVAFSSFALMSTGCSDKKDKDDEEETEVEETEEETEAEETEAEETEVEETEAEETEEIVIDETIDIDLDDDFSFDLPENDLSVYTSDVVASYAETYTEQGYFLMPMSEENGDEIPEGFVDGFMGMGGDETTMEIVAVVLFENREYADAFIAEGMEELDFGEPTETDDGVEYAFTQDGADVVCSVSNDGLVYLVETMDMSTMYGAN